MLDCAGKQHVMKNISVIEYYRNHYKKYLVLKINQNQIDPLPLYDIGKLRAILTRDEVKVPNQRHKEGEEQYAERLRQVFMTLFKLYYCCQSIAHQREAPLVSLENL